jgi:hypothetical protein
MLHREKTSRKTRATGSARLAWGCSLPLTVFPVVFFAVSDANSSSEPKQDTLSGHNPEHLIEKMRLLS